MINLLHELEISFSFQRWKKRLIEFPMKGYFLDYDNNNDDFNRQFVVCNVSFKILIDLDR